MTQQIKNFIDVGDPDAPIGSAAWCKAVHVHLCAMKRQTDKEIRRLKYDLLEFRQNERWRQLADDRGRPFGTWEDYVQYPEPNGLGLAIESAKAVLEALDDRALLGTVLGKHGGDRRSEKAGDQDSNANLKLSPYSRAYILARLERDGLTELAERVRVGKLSANAAAIEAGFRKKSKHRCPKCGHEW